MTLVVCPSPRGQRFNDMTLSGRLRTLEIPAVPHGIPIHFPCLGGRGD